MNQSNIQILVVDDEESVRSLLKEIFLDEGYEVKVAESAKVALDILAKHPIDIVFTDISMPSFSGIDLLKRVKSIRENVEVVIMTAYASVESAIKATRYGASDYLQKPFDDLDCVTDLAEKIALRIQLRREKEKTLQSVLDIADEAVGKGGEQIDRMLIEDARALFQTSPSATDLEEEQEAGSYVKGSIADVPVPKLLQMLALLKKTGTLKIIKGSKVDSANVDFDKGEPIFASLEKVRGAKAIYRMLGWCDGSFEFIPVRREVPHLLRGQMEDLILEGLRQFDEIKALGNKVPPGYICVKYNEYFEQTVTMPSPEDAALIKIISQNGRIDFILDNSPYNDLDTIRTLIHLKDIKAITIVEKK